MSRREKARTTPSTGKKTLTENSQQKETHFWKMQDTKSNGIIANGAASQHDQQRANSGRDKQKQFTQPTPVATALPIGDQPIMQYYSRIARNVTANKGIVPH